MTPMEQPERAATGGNQPHAASLLDPLPAPTNETTEVPRMAPNRPLKSLLWHFLPFIHDLTAP